MIAVCEIGVRYISLASTPEDLLRTGLRRFPLEGAGGVLSPSKTPTLAFPDQSSFRERSSTNCTPV